MHYRVTTLRNPQLERLSKKLPIDILIEVNDHFVSTKVMILKREEQIEF